jgi:hypothetical protein
MPCSRALSVPTSSCDKLKKLQVFRKSRIRRFSSGMFRKSRTQAGPISSLAIMRQIFDQAVGIRSNTVDLGTVQRLGGSCRYRKYLTLFQVSTSGQAGAGVGVADAKRRAR